MSRARCVCFVLTQFVLTQFPTREKTFRYTHGQHSSMESRPFRPTRDLACAVRPFLFTVSSVLLSVFPRVCVLFDCVCVRGFSNLSVFLATAQRTGERRLNRESYYDRSNSGVVTRSCNQDRAIYLPRSHAKEEHKRILYAAHTHGIEC